MPLKGKSKQKYTWEDEGVEAIFTIDIKK